MSMHGREDFSKAPTGGRPTGAESRPLTQLRLRGDDVPWREVAEEVVALDIATARYFNTNKAGRVLWNMLARGTTRPELAQQLVKEFGIDAEQAFADVDMFLGELTEYELLEPESDSSV